MLLHVCVHLLMAPNDFIERNDGRFCEHSNVWPRATNTHCFCSAFYSVSILFFSLKMCSAFPLNSLRFNLGGSCVEQTKITVGEPNHKQNYFAFLSLILFGLFTVRSSESLTGQPFVVPLIYKIIILASHANERARSFASFAGAARASVVPAVGV